MKNNNIFKAVVAIAVALAFLTPGSAATVSEPFDLTVVSIDPSSQMVEKGETFFVDIFVEPGEPIVGMNVDSLSFDSTLIHAVSVTEGDLFAGITTFFMPGNIDNVTGDITSISVVTLPPTGVSAPGTFCTIEFIAQQGDGISVLDLEGVAASDINGDPVLTIVANDGEVTVGEPPPNNPPYTPSNPDPGDSATDVDVDAYLSWTGGDPDPRDTVTYDIYFGTTSPPPKVVGNQSSTTYDPDLNYETLYYWQIVAWDNHGASAEGPIWDFTTGEEEDTTPPVTTHEFEPSMPNGDNNWYVTDVTITLVVTDDLSGVDVTYYRIDGGTWEEYDDSVVVSEDNEHALEYYSVDNAENIEEINGPFNFKIDQTPPVTTCDLDGTMEGGVYITDVTVTLTATDDMSGVNYTMYSVDRGEWYQYADPFVVSDDGDHIVWFYSVDLAGNIEDTKSESFTIQHPCPIEIEISGGLGVSAVITNTGEEDVTDLEWSITITGGLLGLIDKQVNDIISILAAGDSATVESGIFLGLGSISITVTAGCVEETTDGKQIIIFTII